MVAGQYAGSKELETCDIDDSKIGPAPETVGRVQQR
jgi:hypothetical protein